MTLSRGWRYKFGRHVTALRGAAAAAALALLGLAYRYHDAGAREMPYSTIAPRIIDVDLPGGWDGRGGLIAVDLNGDGRRDFLATKPGHIAALDGRGPALWRKRADIQITSQAETEGLPGEHAPGVQAADIDGDGRTEVLFLGRGGGLNVLDGASGETRSGSSSPRPPAASAGSIW